VTNPGNQTGNEADTVSLDITASDPNPGTTLTFSATGLPPGLSISSTGATTARISGTIAYTAVTHPATQQQYSVTVTASDGGLTGSTSFTWLVNDVNRVPVATDDDAGTVVHDRTLTAIDVLANDTDADTEDTLTIDRFDSPSANGGTVACGTTCTYTPPVGFVGFDSFTYEATDGIDVSNTATVTIEVTNQAPVAVDDSATTEIDVPVTVNVLANDSDPDGDTITINSVNTAGTSGSVTCSATACTYTPPTGFTGTDTFRYDNTDGIAVSTTATVTVNVQAVALPPEVTSPGDQASSEADAVSLQIVASDPNGDTLTFSATGLPPGLAIGATTGLISGTIDYTAVTHPDTSRVYAVTVTASDGGLTGAASFNWTVSDVNQVPQANDDAVSTLHDQPVTIDVLANDTDADAEDTVSINTYDATSANGGTVVCTDTCSYTPPLGFKGADSFQYDVTDGIDVSTPATVTVTVTNTAPVAVNDAASTTVGTPVVIDVLANDTDADGDTLSINSFDLASANGGTVVCNGACTYTPPAGFVGADDTFTYDATDGIDVSNRALVTVTVTAGPDLTPPVVENPGAQTGNENDAVSLQIVATDDRGNVTYAATGLPSGLSINTNTGLISGMIGYDAVVHPDLSAVYPVTVTVTDTAGNATTVTFDWTVNDVNQVPVANDDAASTIPDTLVTIDVLANDTDADPEDTLSISNFDATSVNGGTVDCSSGTSCSYTPAAGFTGTDSFQYDATDGIDVSNLATVTISVQSQQVPGDVFLSSLNVPNKVNGKVAQVINKTASAKGDGTLTRQDAAVSLEAVADPGIGVVIDPQVVTALIEPGNPQTQYRWFTLFITCQAPVRNGTIDWTATISAAGNSDPSNDVVTGTTSVTCR
jgi:hypothetical protein